MLCEQQLPAGVRCCMYTAPAAAVAALLVCVAQVVSTHTLSSLGYVHQRRMTACLLCLRHICLCTCQIITQRCKFPVNTLESVLPAALYFTIHSPAQSCRQACSLSLYHQSAAVSTACMLLLLYCQHNSIKLQQTKHAALACSQASHSQAYAHNRQLFNRLHAVHMLLLLCC